MPLDRMSPDHQERFKAVLVAQATLHMKDPAKELDRPRLQLYWRSLEAYDIEQIEYAGRVLIDESKYFPKPRDFHAILRDLQKKRQGTTLRPQPGIWCEWCDDMGMAAWDYGDDGAAAEPYRIPFLEVRRIELARRPVAAPTERVEQRRPRFRWKACACRNGNPNYQARARSQDIPSAAAMDEGDRDPNAWSHDEARHALQRYAPQLGRR